MSNIRLRKDNPFSTGVVTSYATGNPVLKRKPIIYMGSELDELYVVKNNDNLFSIARDKYQNSRWWWLIADANNLINPLELQIGQILLIPHFLTITTLYL